MTLFARFLAVLRAILAAWRNRHRPEMPPPPFEPLVPMVAAREAGSFTRAVLVSTSTEDGRIPKACPSVEERISRATIRRMLEQARQATL